MPFYDWKEETTGVQVQVFRTSLSDYNKQPAEDEIPADSLTRLPAPEARKWVRIVAAIKTIHPIDFTYKGNR